MSKYYLKVPFKSGKTLDKIKVKVNKIGSNGSQRITIIIEDSEVEDTENIIIEPVPDVKIPIEKALLTSTSTPTPLNQ